MIEFLLNPANSPFSVSLTVMLFIALLEGITALLGSGIFAFIDSLLPDIDLDMDAPDLDHSGYFTKTLAWMGIGKVPVVVLLVLFLTAFGLFGLFLQFLVRTLTGFMLPALFASLPAVVCAVAAVRICGRILAKIIPQDETEAVCEESFVGRTAVITLGQAARSKPAQAKLQDTHGQTHYVMVEPDSPEVVFQQGQTVLLIERNGAVFYASDQVPECLISE